MEHRNEEDLKNIFKKLLPPDPEPEMTLEERKELELLLAEQEKLRKEGKLKHVELFDELLK